MAEWWDAPLLPTGRYSDLDEFDPAYLKIRTENSPITIYIQHPIPIPAPGDKNKPPPKPLMLTKKVRLVDLKPELTYSRRLVGAKEDEEAETPRRTPGQERPHSNGLDSS